MIRAAQVLRIFILMTAVATESMSAERRPPWNGPKDDPRISDATKKEIAALLDKPGVTAWASLSTQDGHVFFYVPPGPCSCWTGNAFECSQNLGKSLAEATQQRDQALQHPVECPPNAGCSLGWNRVVVECKAKPPKR